MADELVDDSSERVRRLGVVGAGLLVAVVAGGAAVRSTLPPPPLAVAVSDVTGSALDGESFVRLDLSLRASGARDLGAASFTVAGTTQGASHPVAFDEDGQIRLQVDVTPACGAVTADVGPGRLDLVVHDEQGRERSLALTVPTEGSLERLVRYRCA